MTDAELARALQMATELEAAARKVWSVTTDLPEKDSSQIALRHATAMRKSLEGWIGRRAMRAQLSQTS